MNSEDLDRAEKCATAIIEQSHVISPRFKEETRLRNPAYWLARATLALIDRVRELEEKSQCGACSCCDCREYAGQCVGHLINTLKNALADKQLNNAAQDRDDSESD